MISDPVDLARGVAQLSHKLRDETEGERRLAKTIVEALIDTRLCRTALPTKLGGIAVDPVGMLDVYEILAGGEASVSWTVLNNSLACYLSRFLDATARSEIFGDPSWLYAQSTRPSGTATVVAGGYQVSGRWPLVSGCELAEWLLLLCTIPGEGTPNRAEDLETRFVFVRKGSFEILDTWHAGGLRGSGSHDVTVRDVFVSADHTLSPVSHPTLEGPLAHLPMICTVAAGFAAQALGIARTTVDAIVSMARSPAPPGAAPALCERPATQFGVASHAAALDASRALLRDRLGVVWRRALEEKSADLGEIGEVYAAAYHATQLARAAVDAMYALGGTRSLYSDAPLERAHRDLRAMLQHVVAQPMWVEDAGRVRFGLPPLNPLYAL